MKDAVRKYGWGTIIGLQVILLAMAAFSLLLASGSATLVFVEHDYLPAFLCGLSAAGLGWPTTLLLRRFYRALAGKALDPPTTKPANADWLTGRLYDDQRGRWMLLLIFILVFAGGLSFVLIQNAPKPGSDAGFYAVPLWTALFWSPLFATLLNWMIKLLRAERMFGKGELRLVEGAGRLGSTFQGRFIVHGSAGIKEGLRAEISCRRYDFRHRRTNHQSHDADLLWWSEIEFNADTVGRIGQDGLPVNFQIPHDLPPSGTDERTRHTEWLLEITSLPSSRHLIQFTWTIPVLKPGVSLESVVLTGQRP